MADLPEDAERALSAWRLLNQVRELPGAGALIVATVVLSPFEASLLATIETTMQGVRRAPAQAQEDIDDGR